MNNASVIIKTGDNIEDFKELSGGSGGSSITQVQSDWEQNNSGYADFIKNKPDLSNYVSSEDMNTAISEAVENIDTPEINLSNYYTKNEIDNLFENINTILETI